MPRPHIALLGKAAKKIMQLRGGGSALPGLIIEKMDPDFLSAALQQLPRGVVVITGTNGKTTTTKMVVSLLESQGLKVFTNKTGSNFSRGVVSALLNDMTWQGRLDADIAVLELDEAHAVHFAKKIKPLYTLLLNVLRDQLDRFGEIDYTASLLKIVAENTTEKIVLNRDDPRLNCRGFAEALKAPVYTFGVDKNLEKYFPSDDQLHCAENFPPGDPGKYYHDDVCLSDINTSGSYATFTYNGQNHRHCLHNIKGIYNLLNATAAIALTRVIMGDKLNETKMYHALSATKPAFGRGEIISINGDTIELVLVKNPSGFRLALSSLPKQSEAIMIAINDNYADGRDMSWLWDVDFSVLKDSRSIFVTGIRAYDLALRLHYDDVQPQAIEENLEAALSQFVRTTANHPKFIFCTYTAMLSLRSFLSKITTVEEAIS